MYLYLVTSKSFSNSISWQSLLFYSLWSDYSYLGNLRGFFSCGTENFPECPLVYKTKYLLPPFPVICMLFLVAFYDYGMHPHDHLRLF